MTLDKLWELYELWVAKVLELRETYRAAGRPEDEWRVSIAPGAERTEYEPDASLAAELWESTESNNLVSLEERKLEKLTKYGKY